MNYSKALGVVRAAKGLQQKELAELLNITPSYISKIEKGERVMPSQLVDKLCKELSIPPELFRLIGQDSSSLDDESTETIDSLGRELLNIILENKK